MAEGPTSISYAARDLAGNQEAVKTHSLQIDMVAPSITGSRSPQTPANAAGWNNADVVALFECSEPGGIDTCTAPVAMSTEGANQTASGSALDRAGNTASASVSAISIDKTKPTINGSRLPAANSAGWSKTDVTVSFTCADALSGIARMRREPGPHTEGAGQSHTGTATDKADNSDTAAVSGISIDKTVPTITGARSARERCRVEQQCRHCELHLQRLALWNRRVRANQVVAARERVSHRGARRPIGPAIPRPPRWAGFRSI